VKYLEIGIWLNKHGEEPTRHGYTPQTKVNRATFRLGPLVVAWELVEDD
jgi:hypothetical protein